MSNVTFQHSAMVLDDQAILLTSLNFSNTTRSSSNIAGFAEFAEM
jgi:hypothetical protein